MATLGQAEVKHWACVFFKYSERRNQGNLEHILDPESNLSQLWHIQRSHLPQVWPRKEPRGTRWKRHQLEQANWNLTLQRLGTNLDYLHARKDIVTPAQSNLVAEVSKAVFSL